jgi:hypothetical protein
MIYLRTFGGLCNRLRAIDSGVALARKYDRKLNVIWGVNSDLNISISDIFQCEYLRKYINEIIEINSNDSIWQKFQVKCINFIESKHQTKFDILRNNILLKLCLLDPRVKVGIRLGDLSKISQSADFADKITGAENEKRIIQESSELIEKQLEESKDIYIESSYRLFPFDSELSYSMFVPTQSLMTKIEEISKKFTNTIGVHIRRTDHKLAIRFNQINDFERIISAHIASNHDNTVFLATDNKETKDHFINKYKDKIIINEFEHYERNISSSIQEAVVDLFCLSKTRMIYGSHYSSFSQSAAEIGNIDLTTEY